MIFVLINLQLPIGVTELADDETVVAEMESYNCYNWLCARPDIEQEDDDNKKQPKLFDLRESVNN